MEKDKILQGFEQHNKTLDNAVKNELAKIKSKNKINLLGFGLGDGGYEKTLAQYILQEKIAKEVQIFGFDPYADKSSGIEFLTAQQLPMTMAAPKFDLMTARWVLHHVGASQRWEDFVNCINRCNPNALVLVVEHGFLKKKSSGIDAKLYELLNATFDVIANIGIRPHWFTATTPSVGDNFYIHYLKPKDFETIRKSTTCITTQHIYEIGPNFPNQTIYSMRL